MIGTLRPPPLDAAEFEATLTKLLDDFADRSRLQMRRAVDADFTEHSYAMRICVYRVLQEALNNIEQHAQATTVSVRLKELGHAVFLSVTDDGVGFTPECFSDPDTMHFGLRGMEERVEHLGGFLEIRSEPGLGSAVRAYIPGRKASRGRSARG
jgi:signal transduction histidine kinase